VRRPRELASMRPFTLVASALLAVAAQAGKFPDAYSEPPKGYSGPVFRLSQDYPTEMPKPSPKPWERFDPVTQPDEYIRAILAYCLEGNLEVDFAGQNNKVRKWYHVPWLHWGLNGRDYMRGLTFELAAPPGKLADTQKSWATNCAVGMYNAEGGYIIGKVWADPDNPRKGNIKFPNGTCVFKLLFTTAPVEELPFLKNSKEWQGVIASPVGPYDTSVERSQKTVRLLQIDVAVRDDRVKETGWVFGTFVYDGNQPGAGVFERCVPVGLMVGNDPTLTPDQRADTDPRPTSQGRTAQRELDQPGHAALRMALEARDGLARATQRARRQPGVELHVLSQHGRLPEHHVAPSRSEFADLQPDALVPEHPGRSTLHEGGDVDGLLSAACDQPAELRSVEVQHEDEALPARGLARDGAADGGADSTIRTEVGKREEGRRSRSHARLGVECECTRLDAGSPVCRHLRRNR